MGFTAKLNSITQKNNSLVCIGLDSEMSKLPEHLEGSADPQFEFNKAIIDATADLVCAYKPNMAFYEAEGLKGIEALKKTMDYIPKHIPIILDAKRGDIDNTSRLYAQACFDYFGADAVTIHGYMGTDTVKPFLEYEDKAIFVLVKTSNKSAGEIEDIEGKDGKKVYLRMAEQIAVWNTQFSGRAGAVVGATYPADLLPIRQILPNAPLLIPGLGKQGGDAENTVINGMDARKAGILVNNSRSIIFASTGTDFAEVARAKAIEFRDQLNSYRQ
ncbi:orotidine 5'-phosphate decarboxylase [Candidatus Wirthbacteria bacterium CG2_30_54_11]|uniref:Orotidine 5'-phosphate decarboxylase n=1 Tax=Candidatus Wirthbacteria bacterium CG2_30_54_11 TaxID=1817892 RepID=A0A1J5IS65_9BACT|nr:MAG: orotidine 5'-phosphate decarboxylase [Candidatus Wirthbacteria bacterium CG2_30_54_11]